MLIRPATHADGALVATIYAPHVLTGTATFEEVPPSADGMAGRIKAVLDAGMPWFVAVAADGTPLGYAYASPYRARAAYRYTAETSVYLAEKAQGQGLGTQLMAKVLAVLKAAQIREVVAVIGGGDNAASLGLHHKLGFRDVGVLERVGHKFGKSVDTVILQLSF